jgi:hypothetical protein
MLAPLPSERLAPAFGEPVSLHAGINSSYIIAFPNC